MKTSSLIQLILGVFIGLFRFSIYIRPSVIVRGFWPRTIFNRGLDFLRFIEYIEFPELLRWISLILGVVIIFIGLFIKNHVMRFIYSMLTAVILIVNLYYLRDFVINIPQWLERTGLALIQIINFTVIVSLSVMVGLGFVKNSTTVNIIKLISWIPIFFGIIYFIYFVYLLEIKFQSPFGYDVYLWIFDYSIISLLFIPVSLISYNIPKYESLDQEYSYHPLQISDTKYCQKCGTSTSMETIICANCNTIFPNSKSSSVSSNNSFLYIFIGFCIPIVGLILYITLKDTQPENAKSSGIGALVSTAISFILFAIALIIVFMSEFF